MVHKKMWIKEKMDEPWEKHWIPNCLHSCQRMASVQSGQNFRKLFPSSKTFSTSSLEILYGYQHLMRR
jgi:hypothetical protein